MCADGCNQRRSAAEEGKRGSGVGRRTAGRDQLRLDGDLLIALGHALFLVNVGGLVSRFYRLRAVAAYSAA